MALLAHITQKQAKALIGQQYDDSSYCNPVQDGLGRWVISIQEMHGLGLECEIVEWVAPTEPELPEPND